MKTTHTPGPWTADKHYVHAQGIRFLAVSGTVPNHGNHLEAEANARLIAAAPAMFTQLDTCPVIRLGESLEDFKPRFQAWHRETSALLATLSP